MSTLISRLGLIALLAFGCGRPDGGGETLTPLALEAMPLPTLENNEGIYPSDAVMARLYTITPYDQKTQRVVNRLWTRVKSGR